MLSQKRSHTSISLQMKWSSISLVGINLSLVNDLTLLFTKSIGHNVLHNIKSVAFLAHLISGSGVQE